MEKKNKENSTSLEDLLAMFEDNISIADINASRYLGKISASIVKRRMENVAERICRISWS